MFCSGFQGRGLPPAHPTLMSVSHLGPPEAPQHGGARWGAAGLRGPGDLCEACLCPPLPPNSPSAFPGARRPPCLHRGTPGRATPAWTTRSSLLSLAGSGPCLWGTVLATPSDPILTKCLRQTRRTLNPNRGAEKRPFSPGLWVLAPPPQSLSALSPPGGTRVPATWAPYSLGPRLLLCSPRRRPAWGRGERPCVTEEPTPAHGPWGPPGWHSLGSGL